MQTQRTGGERTLYAVLIITACAILGAILFSLRSGTQMIDKIGPLADATMEVGMDASQAHLWLMEASVRDNQKYLDTARYHLEQARLLAIAMLEGGRIHEQPLAPLEDPTMREKLEEIRESLEHLLKTDHNQLTNVMKEHGYKDRVHSHDLVFADLLEQTAEVEEELRRIIRQEHSYFRHVQLILILICIGFFILVGTVFVRYLSARKRYEARIKRLNSILRAIKNVNHLISREKDPARLITSTCELLVETRGLHNAWITLVDETGRPTIQSEAGLGEDFAQGRKLLEQGKLLPCCLRSLKQDGILVIENPNEECLQCPLSTMYTGRSGLASKLEHSGRIYGFLVVSSPRAYAYDEEEHGLFAELAADIALSLHLLRVEEERSLAEQSLRESEERYRTLAANIPGCDIYLFDRELRYLVAEGSEMRNNGLSGDFYEGKTLYETWDESLVRVFEPFYQNTLNGQASAAEFTCCEKHYFLSTLPIYDSNKQVVGGIALSQNITERKLAEESLKRSESILRHTFEAIPDLISVHDADFNVVLSNWHDHSEALDRYQAGSTKCHEAYMADDVPCEPCHAKDVFKTGKPLRLERTGPQDGISREINVYPILDEDGKVTMITEHVRDISERKRAEKLQTVLFRISEATNLTTNLEELLETIHETLGSLIDTTNFYVALYDQKKEMYTFPYCVDEYDGADFPPDQLSKSLTDYVRKTGMPLLADENTHKRLQKNGDVEMVGQPSLIWLGVPLTTSSGVIGVVVVQSYTDPKLYSETDMALMTFVSGHVTMAIERKLAEEALRDSEGRLRAIFEQASVGVALISSSGYWLTVNERLCDIVGYSREELLKTSCRNITYPEDIEALPCIADQSSGDYQKNCTCEKRYTHKTGKPVWVNVSAAVVEDPHRAERYMVAIIQDISERKEAETMIAEYTDQLLKANRELESKQEELEEFIYTVSHDLKAPIVSISGFAGLLHEKLSAVIDGSSVRHLDRIKHNAAVMEALIGDLLELSRIGRTEEQEAAVDIDELAEEVIESFAVTAQSRNIRLSKAGPLPPCQGRHQRLRQLLSNLIDNAIKYMPENKDGHVEIGYDTNAKFGDVTLRAYYVRDNGDGIPGEFQERIFTMFQRAPTSNGNTEGTGVGLAIAKRIVEKHGGQIWVESRQDQGSTFYFTISDRLDMGSLGSDGSDVSKRGRKSKIEYMSDE